jgi:hypothetical protein
MFHEGTTPSPADIAGVAGVREARVVQLAERA